MQDVFVAKCSEFCEGASGPGLLSNLPHHISFLALTMSEVGLMGKADAGLRRPFVCAVFYPA